MNIKCTGKFIGGELISREGGKNEHPADRKLKVYRCFSISIAAAFQGRAVISIDQLFRRCFEKVAATHHTPPSFLLSLPPIPIRIGVGRGYSSYTRTISRVSRSAHFRATKIKRAAIQSPLRPSLHLVSSRANNSTNAVSS